VANSLDTPDQDVSKEQFIKDTIKPFFLPRIISLFIMCITVPKKIPPAKAYKRQMTLKVTSY